MGVPGSAKTHRVVCLEVYDPAGALRRCYSGPQLLAQGKNETSAGFTLALDDPEGQWTVKAVELASGKTVRRKIAVVAGTLRVPSALQ